MQKFIRTTTAITASHSNYKKPLQVAVDYYELPTGFLRLVVRSGCNGSAIPNAATLTITREQYQEIPEDPYNSLVEARAALRMLDWEPRI